MSTLNRAGRLAVVLVISLQVLPGCAPPEAETPSGPPNIVLLFADDLGYGDLSSYGHPTIRTPNLDQLARDGIRLTSFYASAPNCSPSRAALLTGRYPLRANVPRVLGPESNSGLPPSEITIAEALKEQGYRTAAIGKWHLGTRDEYLPTANGFDSYFGLLYSNDMKPPWVQTDKPLELYRNTEPIEHPVDQSTLTTRYTEEAVRFIEEDREEPFFLYLPYTMPHLPLHTAEQFREQSRAGLYGDIIETIDWSVGRILDALETQGVADNTIVIFTSDNGPWSNMPPRMLQEGIQRWHAGTSGLLRGAKHMTYEGGMRVPGIVRWPGEIPTGQVSAEPAATIDLYVTLLKVASAPIPDDRPVDGLDILPLLKGEAPSPRDTLFYFRNEQLEAVRQGSWKLRLSSHARDDLSEDAPPTPELFNLDLDPSERYNVADDHPDRVDQMRQALTAFAVETGALTEF